MSIEDDVERLAVSHFESEEVRSLLQAGISDDDVDYDYEGGLSAHLAAIGAPGSASPEAAGPPNPAAPARLASASSKALVAWLGVPLASLSVAAALVLFRGHAPRRTTAVSNEPALASPATDRATDDGEKEAAPSGVLQPEIAAGELSPGAAAPEATTALRSRGGHAERRRRPERADGLGRSQVAASEPSPPSATSELDKADGTIVRSLSNDWGEPAPSVAPSAQSSRDAAAEERTLAEEEARRREAREAARRVAESSLQEEMDELMRAKRALSSNPKRALELAEHGEHVYRQSLLSEERQHVHLLALIALGRVDEAARLAAPYLAKHPNSPFARRVQMALDAASSRRSSH